MVSADIRSVIDRAKRIYADQLQAALESQHRNRFVAIEPESGDYFLGDTFDGRTKGVGSEWHLLLINAFGRIHLRRRPPMRVGDFINRKPRLCEDFAARRDPAASPPINVRC